MATVTLTCILVKAFVVYRDFSQPGIPPLLFDGRLSLFVLRSLMCSSEDIAVGLFVLLAAIGARRLVTSRGLRRGLVAFVYGTGILAVAWMIVNAVCFHAIRRFVNASLLALAGGLRLERSIYTFATGRVITALILVPCGVLAAACGLAALFRRAAWLHRIGRLAVAVPLLVAVAGTSVFARSRWFTPANDDFVHNPHLLFLESWLRSFRSFDIGPGTSEDLREFEPSRRPPALAPVAGTRPRNLVLVVMESVSAEYMHIYRSPFATTPELERSQTPSLIFDNVYSTATNSASAGLSLFGSEYNAPSADATIMSFPSYPLASAAEWLRGQGYQTMFFGGGDWGYLNMDHFIHSGFELARDRSRYWSPPRPGEPEQDNDSDRMVFAAAQRALEQRDGRPFLLVIWTYDTHAPYRRGAEAFLPVDQRLFPAGVMGERTDYRALPARAVYPERASDFHAYLANIASADHLIGALVAGLVRSGLSSSTLVVVTGDHGEAFGQHGWFSHGHGLFEEDVHVPLIMLGPSLAIYPSRDGSVGSHVDLWPTLASLVGVPPHPAWQGRSLLEPADDTRPRRAYFMKPGGPGALGVREGSIKYIWDFHNNVDYLFDVEADPGEHHNLVDSRREDASRLRSRLRAWALFEERRTRDRLASAAPP